uniref:Pleckstrin homology like domain family A member 2 n=1 Tax=Nomascus leucogenys TaxID=61853 RepID=G1RJ66_NOMLE
MEEEARRAHLRPPEPVPRQPPRPPQGAALPLHPQGGLRGAHGQVRVLHHRHHRPQGDRLPLRGRELLERGHRAGAHRFPEPPRPAGLSQPPGTQRTRRARRTRRGRRGRRTRRALGAHQAIPAAQTPHAMSPPRAIRWTSRTEARTWPALSSPAAEELPVRADPRSVARAP